MNRTFHRSTLSPYSSTARGLHWLTVVLVALQVPVGVYMVYRGGTLGLWDGLTGALYSGHKLAGLVILALVVWRLVYRATRGAPPDELTLAPWQRIVAHFTHWALYALLLAVPIAGYIGIALFPALDVFGLFKLPAPVGPDKEAAKLAFAVHGALALGLVGLAALHVGAALHHYLILKDNVLGRMIPSLRRR